MGAVALWIYRVAKPAPLSLSQGRREVMGKSYSGQAAGVGTYSSAPLSDVSFRSIAVFRVNAESWRQARVSGRLEAS